MGGEASSDEDDEDEVNQEEMLDAAELLRERSGSPGEGQGRDS
jgi:hypothetical protein